MAISFQELVQAAHELSPAQKLALVASLRWDTNRETTLTREQAIAELEALRATGAFEGVESLRGKYARPDVEISEAELNDYLHEIGTAWELDIDDPADN